MGQVLHVLHISVQLGPRRTTMVAGPHVAVGAPQEANAGGVKNDIPSGMAFALIGFPAGPKASRLQDLRGYR